MSERKSIPCVPVPDGAMPVKTNRSAMYRTLIEHALKHELEPEIVNTRGMQHKTVTLNSILMERVKKACKGTGLSEVNAVAGLIKAAIIDRLERAEAQEKEDEQRREVLEKAKGFESTRPAQMKFYKELVFGLDKNSIVMAEASTGVGKGRAMMAAAVEQVRSGKSPIVVAAPTLATMTRLHEEFGKLDKNNVDTKGVRIAVRPGQTEFVDDVRLKEWVEQTPFLPASELPEAEDLAMVKGWVESGGKCTRETTLSKSMQDAGVPAAWLMDDLVAISPNFDWSPFSLRNSKHSEGSLARQTLDEYLDNVAEDAEIILCTHAMLCIAQKTAVYSKEDDVEHWNPRILKKPEVIILDEAHQFEQTVAQINTEILSLVHLRSSLRKFMEKTGAKKTSVAGRCFSLVGELIHITRDKIRPDLNGGSNIRLDTPEPGNNYETQLFQDVLDKLQTLADKKYMGSRALNNMDDIDDYRGILRAIVKTIKGSSDPVRVSYSPIRKFPSIMGGTSKLYYPITALWKAATGGAVLASATLYLPDPAGGQTCDYLRSVLYLPIERIHAPQPIVAPYLYTLPTLHYPKGDELQKKLSAPKARSMSADEQEKAENEWLSNVANVLADGPAKTAKGGTMILCTSYTQIEKLAQFLLDRDVGIWRIVEQKRNGKFTDLRLKFIESAHKGQRPIMLALGAAWTGVDFMDERFSGAPEKDMLLTDLVIVRCPIGLNRSYAMLERFDKQGTYPISCEALLVLKQGLGRLIRQDGVKDRHIWFLDGRLWQPWFKMENFTAAARNMLGKYENIKEL